MFFFRGALQDMAEFYASVNAFVLPSLSSEGLSLAQLEAMAAGLPVIATNVAGAAEAIVDKASGIIVPRDDIESLTDALGLLAGASDISSELGRVARNRIRERFMGPSFVQTLIIFIDQCVTFTTILNTVPNSCAIGLP